MKEKTDRNERLYAYWLKHPGMSYKAIARIFHISKPRAWLIINQEAKKTEVVNAEQDT
jgi:transposase